MKQIIIAGVILVIPFYVFPNLDIAFSQLFYNAEEGFWAKNNPVVLFIYDMVKIISVCIVLALFSLALTRFLRGRGVKIFCGKNLLPSYRQLLFLFLALVLGPGLIVHNVIKDNTHHPRPGEIKEFGGNKDYVLPFMIGKEEGKSFVSGHASIGFYFVSLALLFSGRRRIACYIFAITLGGIIGLGRIMQGGHFLSDVVFSGIVILLTCHILHYLLFSRQSRVTSRE